MKKQSIVLLILLLAVFNASAKEYPPLRFSLTGKQIVSLPLPVTLNAVVPGMNNSNQTTFNLGAMITTFQNKIELSLKNHSALDEDVKITVQAELTYYQLNEIHPIETNLTLEVDFHAGALTKSKITDLFAFRNAYEIKFILKEVKLSPDNEALKEKLADFIEINAEFTRNTVERINYNETVTVEACEDSRTDELVIHWNALPEAEKYELEYTFADDYTADYNVPALAINIPYNFNENSTRIAQTETWYRLPEVAERGWYLFRVRAIGWGGENLDAPVWCKWNGPEKGMVGDFPNKYHHDKAHMDDKMNWQVSTTFAEEGKRSDVVSYFDGSFRMHETVTAMNLERQLPSNQLYHWGHATAGCAQPGWNKKREVIAGETVYDFQGRAAVTILPVPTNSEILQFIPRLNISEATKKSYCWEDFDKAGYTCPETNALLPLPDPLTGIMSASAYYSTNNPDKLGFNAFIPDAEKFPFTQVSYLQDNTGRIAAQSGVGKTFQFGQGGHETRFYYAAPNQEELDRLFGTEAGDAMRYQKNAVMDPNGQVAVTYLNPEGKTIATALAGNSPENLDPLPKQEVDTFIVSLYEKTQTNKVDHTLIVEHQFMVSADDTRYIFNYTMLPEMLQEITCNGKNVCLDCIYDLTITLRHNESCDQKTLMPFSGTIGKLMELNAVDLNCNNDTIQFVKPDTLLLDIGTYTLTKKLTVNAAAANAYIAEVFKDTCKSKWNEILTDELSKVDTMDCYRSCLTCKEPPEKTETCDPEYCKPAPNRCDIIRQMMISHLTPGGQYAQFDMDEKHNVNASAYPLSIFNPRNYLPDRPQLETINDLLAPNKFSSYTELFAKWKPEFAEALISLHPENCMYKWCNEPNIDATLDFDVQILSTEYIHDAITNQYVTEGSLPPKTASKPYQQLVDKDPLFQNGDPHNLKTILLEKLNNYGCPPGAGPVDKLAMQMARCALSSPKTMPNGVKPAINLNGPPCEAPENYFSQRAFGFLPPNPTESDRRLADLEWTFLRTLYLSAKNELLQKNMNAKATSEGCNSRCIGSEDYEHWSALPLFLNWLHFTPCHTPFGFCSIFYADKQSCFSTGIDNIMKAWSDEGIPFDATTITDLDDPCQFANALLAQSQAINQAVAENFCCEDAQGNPMPGSLCDSLPDMQETALEDGCVKFLLATARLNAQTRYNHWVDSLKADLLKKYYAKCMAPLENLSVKYIAKEYHYTLYFYDQAGNLVKTVPPAGVKLLNPAEVLQVQASRKAGYSENIRPEHYKTTIYQYNTLNELIWQSTPDAGVSNFFYDKLGRIAASQNAQQKEEVNFYSYSLYDKLGRMVETGELNSGEDIPVKVRDYNIWAAFLNGLNERTEITFTQYDKSYSKAIAGKFGAKGQTNLRKRVASIFSFENAEKLNAGEYLHATHYTYDIEGNVYKLIQDYLNGIIGDKTIEYEYDLQSGKVNAVIYQRNQPDQFFHKYKYDMANRLTEVKTSANGLIWETDATYMYYRHGPLARTEYGTDKVQGLDYLYTLQGWIKGVNGTTETPEADMGRDGYVFQFKPSPVDEGEELVELEFSGPGYKGIHQPVAKDAFGYVLEYFPGDYSAIAGNDVLKDMAQKAGTVNALFNGNISRMYTQIQTLGNNGFNYRYDQLNRIMGQEAWTIENHSIAMLPGDAYRSAFTYDADGNILNQVRNGKASLPDMDKMDYYYYNANQGIYDPKGEIPPTNKLAYVYDEVPKGNYDVDIDEQISKANYQYDLIGNLVSDAAENISSIKWNLQNKIAAVNKSTGMNISFQYDALGNRVKKEVTGGTEAQNASTFYVRDAQGNIMATYVYSVPLDHSSTDKKLYLEEVEIYGSSRLGIDSVGLEMTLGDNASVDQITNPATTEVTVTFAIPGNYPVSAISQGEEHFVRCRGFVRYELSNHLGNVLGVITDRKLPSASDDGITYSADVLSAQDYYAFGMVMPGRNSEGEGYRFGFQRQEGDDEVLGEGNSVNFSFRMYDARLGRFFTRDPLAAEYSFYSPYVFSGNIVISAIEVEGLEPAWICQWSTLTEEDINYIVDGMPADKAATFKSVIVKVNEMHANYVNGTGPYRQYFSKDEIEMLTGQNRDKRATGSHGIGDRVAVSPFSQLKIDESEIKGYAITVDEPDSRKNLDLPEKLIGAVNPFSLALSLNYSGGDRTQQSTSKLSDVTDQGIEYANNMIAGFIKDGFSSGSISAIGSINIEYCSGDQERYAAFMKGVNQVLDSNIDKSVKRNYVSLNGPNEEKTSVTVRFFRK